MSDQQTIFVVNTQDALVFERIEAFLNDCEGFEALQDAVIVDPSHAKAQSDSVMRIQPQSPIRLGAIMDQMLQGLNAQTQSLLHFGAATLDPAQGVFQADKDAVPVRLTEKEIAVLVLLAKAAGHHVSRQQLLNDVWGYAQDVETHTLETHIYRLRQKIEAEPAHPQILMTSEDGYFTPDVC